VNEARASAILCTAHLRRCVLLALVALFASACSRPDARQVTDLNGHAVDPFEGAPRATVLAFVSTECPISNRYAPELGRLHAQFAPSGVRFYLVYPLAGESDARVREHVREYGYPFGALRDPGRRLVGRAGARVTPEVAVFDRGGALVYHGRIDDRQVDFGQARTQPTRRDLELALEAVLSNRAPEVASAPPIGCSIPRAR
jgi:AhpC/TSA family protein